MKMNRRVLEETLRGHAEVEALNLAQRRRLSPRQRMELLNRIWSIAAELGVSSPRESLDLNVNERWGRLRSLLIRP